MRKIGALALIFSLALLVTACGTGDTYNDNDHYNENETTNDTPRFNDPVLALLTGDEPVVVRYFAAWGGLEVRDVYVTEYAQLAEEPALREASAASRTGVGGDGPWLIESLNELETRTTWIAHHYDEDFFEEYYLLAIQLYTPILALQDVVHTICELGIVTFRPLFAREELGDTMAGQWLALVEMPRNFRVQQFQVQFEGNPWMNS